MWIETLRCDDAPLERRRHGGLRPQSRIAADRERAFGLAQARQIRRSEPRRHAPNDATERRLVDVTERYGTAHLERERDLERMAPKGTCGQPHRESPRTSGLASRVMREPCPRASEERDCESLPSPMLEACPSAPPVPTKFPRLWREVPTTPPPLGVPEELWQPPLKAGLSSAVLRC
jgi:hypothetical protein